MNNFYNYVHRVLKGYADDKLIFWPNQGAANASGLSNTEFLKYISNYRKILLQHVQPGELVLLAIPASVTSVSALLAIQAIGAIPVLPPAKADRSTLLSTIKKQKIKHVITEKKISILFYLFLKWSGLKRLYVNHMLNMNDDWKPAQVDPDQAALITFSSGTTGEPKAIYRSHRVFSAQHLLLKKLFPANEKQRDFPLFPNVILHNLASRTTSILPDIPEFRVAQLDPARIVSQLQSQHIESMTGNVFYLKKLIDYLQEYPQFFDSVKLMVIGGSPVPEDLVPNLRSYFPNAQFHIIYGSSEAEPIATRNVHGAMKAPLSGYAVGSICEEIELRISNASLINTPQGQREAGEIEVRGQHVAKKNGDWLKTGDIGYLTPEKELYLTARIGNERPHGNIQHFQIEHVLILHQGIRRIAAISDNDGFRVLIQGAISEPEVRNLLDQTFPHGIIKSVISTTDIPVDNRHESKVLYHKLK